MYIYYIYKWKKRNDICIVIHISFLSFNLTEIKVFDILIYFIKFKKNEQNLLNFRYLLYLHRDTNNYYFD